MTDSPHMPTDSTTSPWRSRIVGMVALALIVVSAVVITRRHWPSADENQDFKTAQSGPFSNPSAALSTLQIWSDGPSQGLVMLKRANGPESAPPHVHRGLLIRELSRQAFLIAAGDGPGRIIRDETIGDVLPRHPPTLTLDLATLVAAGGNAHGQFWLRRGGAELGDKPLVTAHVDLPSGPYADIPALVETVERLSREEFAKALADVGFPSTPSARESQAEVSEATRRRLGQMSFPAQFAALRDLHDTIQREGESPRLLGALARVYAHLGVLTETHWSAAHKVYKARALIYAQRLVARTPGDSWGLWHRAYAQALVGLHAAALADIQAAREVSPTAKGPEGLADWADLIEAFCRYDVRRLAEADPGNSFAGLLRYLAAEEPQLGAMPEDMAHRAFILEQGREALANNPTCFRIYDGLYALGGVSNMHEVTTVGPEVFRKTLPRLLQELPELPKAVSERLDDEADEVAVRTALVDAGVEDRSGGPSWAALAAWAREARFVQIDARVGFLAWALGVPVQDTIREVRPWIQDHPYLPYLESFAMAGPPRAATLLGMEFRDLEGTAIQAFFALRSVSPEREEVVYRKALHHGDPLARDLIRMVSSLQKPNSSIQDLTNISPYSPTARAARIKHYWDEVKDQAAAWEAEAEATGQPAVFGALGRQYATSGQTEEAIRCLRRYLEFSPDRWAFVQLANVYLANGDEQRWLTTLQEALEGEDTSLDHAQIRVSIANHFMAKSDWERARPYAEAAAQSWAGWAMVCASQCYEGLEDWRQSELWMRRTSERYADSWQAWFQWCLRTGRGNVEAARLLALVHAEALEPHAGRSTLYDIGFFYLLSGVTERAEAIFTNLFDTASPGEAMPGLVLAMLADEQADDAQRDAILEQIGTAPETRDLYTAKVCALFLESLAEDTPELDLDAVDPLLDAMEDAKGNMAYFVGRFLERRGRSAEAQTYYEYCATHPESTTTSIVLLSIIALREREGVPATRQFTLLGPGFSSLCLDAKVLQDGPERRTVGRSSSP